MPSRPFPRTRLLALAFVVTVVAAVPLSIVVLEQRALSEEEAYIAHQLENASCLTDWGVNEGAGPRRDASITKRTGFSVLVRVTVPYSHTVKTDDGQLFADSASEATYEVTFTDARRISGDEISPC